MKNVMMYIRMSSYVLHVYTSLSTMVLISRDWKESYGFRKNCTLKIKLYWLECIGKAVMMLYLG